MSLNPDIKINVLGHETDLSQLKASVQPGWLWYGRTVTVTDHDGSNPTTVKLNDLFKEIVNVKDMSADEKILAFHTLNTTKQKANPIFNFGISERKKIFNQILEEKYGSPEEIINNPDKFKNALIEGYDIESLDSKIKDGDNFKEKLKDAKNEVEKARRINDGFYPINSEKAENLIKQAEFLTNAVKAGFNVLFLKPEIRNDPHFIESYKMALENKPEVIEYEIQDYEISNDNDYLYDAFSLSRDLRKGLDIQLLKPEIKNNPQFVKNYEIATDLVAIDEAYDLMDKLEDLRPVDRKEYPASSRNILNDLDEKGYAEASFLKWRLNKLETNQSDYKQLEKALKNHDENGNVRYKKLHYDTLYSVLNQLKKSYEKIKKDDEVKKIDVRIKDWTKGL